MTLKEIFGNIKEIIEGKKAKSAIESLYPKIQEAKNVGYKTEEIYKFLRENGLNTSSSNFYKVLSDLNKAHKNEYKSNDVVKNIKKVAIINFKGGVGKSTIANLLDLPNKVIVNLDTQNAKNSNYSDTINYLELKEEYGVDLKETINLLKEEGKEWIVFDTAGSITDELLEIINNVDYVIIPFTKGNRAKETTLDTIKAVLEIKENDNTKFALILNMYQDEDDLKELKEVEEEAKKILGDKLACSTALKFSKAVSTMEKTKKSIEELDLTNKIAYRAFKKRVKEMNDKLKECLFAQKFKPEITKYKISFE